MKLEFLEGLRTERARGGGLGDRFNRRLLVDLVVRPSRPLPEAA